jgi:hypothetical protein
MTVNDFFAGQDLAREIYEAVISAVGTIGPSEIRVSKSQISFRRRKAFAFVWMPGQYLHREAAPLVLTLSFRTRDPSPRWKEIYEAAPGRFTHHLELYSVNEVDDQVCGWLREAWSAAGKVAK